MRICYILNMTSKKIDKKAFDRDIGQKLKKKRKARKISQTEMAIHLGLYQSAWARVESGYQGLTHYDYIRAMEYINSIPRWTFPIRKKRS